MDYDGNFEYSRIIEVSLDDFGGDIRLYPNPVEDQLIIANGVGTAKVYNSIGDLITEFPIIGNKQQLNTSQFVAGLYTIVFYSNINQKAFKFYKGTK